MSGCPLRKNGIHIVERNGVQNVYSGLNDGSSDSKYKDGGKNFEIQTMCLELN